MSISYAVISFKDSDECKKYATQLNQSCYFQRTIGQQPDIQIPLLFYLQEENRFMNMFGIGVNIQGEIIYIVHNNFNKQSLIQALCQCGASYIDDEVDLCAC